VLTGTDAAVAEEVADDVAAEDGVEVVGGFESTTTATVVGLEGEDAGGAGLVARGSIGAYCGPGVVVVSLPRANRSARR